MEGIILKPCPFCGKEIKNYCVDYFRSFAEKLEVKCINCSAEITILASFYRSNGEVIPVEGDSIVKWNTRYNPNIDLYGAGTPDGE